MFKTLLIASTAGIIGTGLGGIVALCFGKSSAKTLSSLLTFAAGIMLSIVCFDLIPEALTLSSIGLTATSIIFGIVAVQLLNRMVNGFTSSHGSHIAFADLSPQQELVSTTRERSMLRSGFIMFAAIALHNLPEGMAIGSTTAHDTSMGITLAILIALHNIPEGMTIGLPLLEGGMNKWKAIGLTALSGAPTFVGGLLGAAFGNLGDTTIAFSLALASGAMLYVTFYEILPQAISLHKGVRPIIFAVVGIVVGIVVGFIAVSGVA